MSLAYRCEICSGRNPHWEIARVGDAVVTWACDDHLAVVCDRLQRDNEVTTLTVENFRKLREWAQIGRALDEVMDNVRR